MSDTPDSESLDDALDRALGRAFKSAEPAEQRPAPSILDHIAASSGSPPDIALRPRSSFAPLTDAGPARAAGKYVVHGELGRGGVGAVHLGHDQELGREVAMKFLHDRYKDNSAVLHRFVEEAQIGGQLQHPGIVPVYDLGMMDGKPFFTMKLVGGETLASQLAARASWSADRQRFLGIYEQVCQAMAYAHARGVVHRDLKPANIMIGAFGEVQVVDWGMGKLIDVASPEPGSATAPEGGCAAGRTTPSDSAIRSRSERQPSLVGSIMGTPPYMPPEQAMGRVDRMDERSDVFALGAILCEILTGQPPYVGPPELLLAMAAKADLGAAMDRLSQCAADADIVALTRRCLARDMEDRPRTAALVAGAVRDHLERVEQRAHDALVRSAALQRTRNLGFLVAGVVAAGLAASVWFWRTAEQASMQESQARVAAERAAERASAAEQRALAAQAEESKSRLQAERNYASFRRLSQVVRLETARTRQREFKPAWPERAAAMQRWLDTEVADLRRALPDLERTLRQLEKKAEPQTAAERAADRREHPLAAELARLEAHAAALRRAAAIRAGQAQSAPHPLDPTTLARSAEQLAQLALPLVVEDRTVFGREGEGLALARAALARAPASGPARILAQRATLFALLANGLDKQAVAFSKEAENLIAARHDPAAVLADVTKRLERIRPEVDKRFRWRFADDADGFLHGTLQRAYADIEVFLRTEVRSVEQKLAWANRVHDLSITLHRDRWVRAREALRAADDVRASSLYRAVPVDLEPQVGLVPIGMNPKTRLWEFYHLRSAWDPGTDPAGIRIPEHGADGSIAVGKDTGIVFVLVPGGTFTMGAQNSDPSAPNFDPGVGDLSETPHSVALSPFFLARHEMTQAQWARLWVGDEQHRYPSAYRAGQRMRTQGGGFLQFTFANPVEQVSWVMCTEALAHWGLSLPTEAQWEYGCRGGSASPFPFPFARFAEFANVADATVRANLVDWACESWSDGHLLHAPAGSFRANGFGLHDVVGNVFEWCRDPHGNYGTERAGDGLRPAGPGTDRVFRGGSCNFPARDARSARRGSNLPTFRSPFQGLRAARQLAG
ncbi:MAG: SUMF1/EgtB/PvdO family nonheme iron enzyme [Planctomycetes bacterium]|nr:SUMF1/EgtB/PvdO family nonheme iron enzyme [Planctomycetota bacterium]